VPLLVRRTAVARLVPSPAVPWLLASAAVQRPLPDTAVARLVPPAAVPWLLANAAVQRTLPSAAVQRPLPDTALVRPLPGLWPGEVGRAVGGRPIRRSPSERRAHRWWLNWRGARCRLRWPATARRVVLLGRGLGGGSTDRICRPPTGLLSRTGFAEVLDPVVIGVAAADLAWAARVALSSSPAAEATTLWTVLAGITHGPDRQRPARMVRAERRALGAPWIGIGGKTPADRTAGSGLVVLGVGPPQIVLVLRPSRGHTDCYS
jgi:hypothetical protein